MKKKCTGQQQSGEKSRAMLTSQYSGGQAVKINYIVIKAMEQSFKHKHSAVLYLEMQLKIFF